MTILFFADISWFGLHQRPQHLAVALASHWNVLWVEPMTWFTPSRVRPCSVGSNLTVVSVPAIPYNARRKAVEMIAKPLSHLALFRKMVSALQLRLIHRALTMISPEERQVGCVINNFHLIEVVEQMHPTVVLFDYIDNAFGFTRLPRHIHDDWVKTIRRADFITVTALGLAQQIQPYRSTGIHYVGNGVEYDVFSSVADDQRPADLPTGSPIVGYIGAVYPWLDYDLLYEVCTMMPDVQFVFIGPIHPRVSHHIARLRTAGNVSLLGFKPYQLLPHYLHHFDVGIIPFRSTDLTKTVNPVKLYEYSAAGKPTVATDFSPELHQFQDTLLLVHSKDECIAALRTALRKTQDPSFTETLQSFARDHDWRQKTSRVIELIQQHLSPPHSSV